jgi:hypothetical protein
MINNALSGILVTLEANEANRHLSLFIEILN